MEHQNNHGYTSTGVGPELVINSKYGLAYMEKNANDIKNRKQNKISSGNAIDSTQDEEIRNKKIYDQL